MRRWLFAFGCWVTIGCGNQGLGGHDGGGGGTTGDGVTCSLGTAVGKASYAAVDATDMLGDRLLVMGAYDSNMDGRNVLVVDLAGLTLTAEWMWSYQGTVVGPAAAPSLLAPPNTTRYPIDLATGMLGAGTQISSSQPHVRDSRVVGADTHVVNGSGEHLVLDAAGALVRATSLPRGMSVIPAPDQFAILDDAIVGLGERSLDGYVQLRRWNLQGELVAERRYTEAELGVADVERLSLVRHGSTAALVHHPGDAVTVRRIDAALELGPASTSMALWLQKLAPQGDGFSLAAVTREDTRLHVIGAHVAADDTITSFEVSCSHRFSAPPFGVFIPADAPKPTWVFHVGSTVWVYAF